MRSPLSRSERAEIVAHELVLAKSHHLVQLAFRKHNSVESPGGNFK